MRETLLKLFNTIQASLFPELESRLQTELTGKEKELIEICCLCRIDEHVPERHQMTGRPARSRLNLFKAFVAKAVYNLPETDDLIEMLIRNATLRRLCGWESASDVPSAPTFSRAFAEFAESQLPQQIHAAMIKEHCANRVIGHISRDSTAIKAREKASVSDKTEAAKPLPNKRGRPRKGEERLPEPTQMEKQSARSLEENLQALPKRCNFGCKRDSQGKTLFWKGYKLHVDGIDGDIPASAILTSASVHDSQPSIPLAQMSAERFQNLYDLMDAAYDAQGIRGFSEKLGHVPVIDRNPRGGDKVEMDPAKALRFNQRSSIERVFSHLENHGLKNVRVKGWAKVFAHLMFGLLVVAANQLFQMLL
jgi:hypothetical protein